MTPSLDELKKFRDFGGNHLSLGDRWALLDWAIRELEARGKRP
jgi:hypothetical protein